jgi:hypothetical protein
MFVLSMVLAAVWGRDLTLSDAEGRRVKPLDEQGIATVFVFTRTDCPISNRYAPEIRRLHDAYGPKGIRFWLVYVDPSQPSEAVRKHVTEYGYRTAALLDPHHDLVLLTGAEVTPEAVVFSGHRIVYRGRIDDRYVAFGKARQSAATHDLENVVAALVAGKAVEPRITRAIGCFISDLK